jgi:hypothetical protein
VSILARLFSDCAVSHSYENFTVIFFFVATSFRCPILAGLLHATGWFLAYSHGTEIWSERLCTNGRAIVLRLKM